MGISSQKIQSERKKIRYIAAASVIFLVALCLILFMFSGGNKGKMEIPSDEIETPPLNKSLPKDTTQDQKNTTVQPTKNVSEYDNEDAKNIADKNETPLGKSSSTEEKTIEKPKKPFVKPLPKPKDDSSDYYTLG